MSSACLRPFGLVVQQWPIAETATFNLPFDSVSLLTRPHMLGEMSHPCEGSPSAGGLPGTHGLRNSSKNSATTDAGLLRPDSRIAPAVVHVASQLASQLLLCLMCFYLWQCSVHLPRSARSTLQRTRTLLSHYEKARTLLNTVKLYWRAKTTVNTHVHHSQAVRLRRTSPSQKDS